MSGEFLDAGIVHFVDAVAKGRFPNFFLSRFQNNVHHILLPAFFFAPEGYAIYSQIFVTHGHNPGVSDCCDVSSFRITPPLTDGGQEPLPFVGIGDRIF